MESCNVSYYMWKYIQVLYYLYFKSDSDIKGKPKLLSHSKQAFCLAEQIEHISILTLRQAVMENLSESGFQTDIIFKRALGQAIMIGQ